MPLVRILVDGYSLLHGWPELAPGSARHSAAARDALIVELRQYRDSIGTPITVVFDGHSAPLGTPKMPSSPELEILFSKQGQTADEVIERVAYRLKDYGEVLVITNDYAERDTVINMGGMAQSCDTFIAQIKSAGQDMRLDLKHHNRREQERYRNRR